MADSPVLTGLSIDLADLIGRLVPEGQPVHDHEREAVDLLRRAWKAGVLEGVRQEQERIESKRIAWFGDLGDE